MFELQTPWWELVARAAIVYLALLVLVRISGKRTVGQFTPFDLLVMVLLSEGVSNGLQGSESSVSGALLIAVTLMGINWAVAFSTARNKRLHDLIEGVPVLIGRDGKLFMEVLRMHRVPLADVQQSLREADTDLEETRLVFLEADGKISIMRKK